MRIYMVLGEKLPGLKPKLTYPNFSSGGFSPVTIFRYPYKDTKDSNEMASANVGWAPKYRQ